jgi:hypothetical protein
VSVCLGGSAHNSNHHHAGQSIPAGWLPDTPEEHRRRVDLADAMFQEMKRQIGEKIRKDGKA